MKFKEGDRVRIKALNRPWWFENGQIGTVRGVGGVLGYDYAVYIDGEAARNPAYVDAENIELYTPKMSKTKETALQTQVGGTHYTDMAIQPAHYNLANNIGWAEGDAISYISRWRNKGGLQDLRKARQTLLLLIEHEESLGTV